MGRLIAISNRTAADPSARAGGLAVAVWESLTSTGGMWFGWSGNIVDEVGPPDHIEDEGVEFVVTDFTEAEHDGFYLQYANRVIWPVFHYRVDLAHFGDTDFATYASVNKRIADMVVPHLKEGDSVSAGQVVIQLRDIQASSDLGANKQRYFGLKAKR